MSKGPWTLKDNPNVSVKSYEVCNSCMRRWYSSDGWGFASCPYCKSSENISTRIDDTQGALGLQSFRGELYSKRIAQASTTNSNTNNNNNVTSTNIEPKKKKKLEEIIKLLEFTGARK